MQAWFCIALHWTRCVALRFYLHNLGQDVKEAEDSVANEVVVAVVVLVLSRQEERLAELPRVQVRDGDRARHHQQHPACHTYVTMKDAQHRRVGKFSQEKTRRNLTTTKITVGLSAGLEEMLSKKLRQEKSKSQKKT